MPYNYNPQPRGGRGAFGAVPGVITPPNPAADLAGQYPNLGQTNAAISRSILAGLEGQLSPATINALQDANAAFGIQSGMPGLRPGSFVTNRLGRNIGLTAEALRKQAVEDYNATIPTISRTQTVSPELLYQIALQNATNSAAPDPGAAARYAESLYNRYLSGMSGGVSRGGGPGGGTRTGTLGGGSPGQIVAPSLSGDTTMPPGSISPEGYQRWLSEARSWGGGAPSSVDEFYGLNPLTNEPIGYNWGTDFSNWGQPYSFGSNDQTPYDFGGMNFENWAGGGGEEDYNSLMNWLDYGDVGGGYDYGLDTGFGGSLDYGGGGYDYGGLGGEDDYGLFFGEG